MQTDFLSVDLHSNFMDCSSSTSGQTRYFRILEHKPLMIYIIIHIIILDMDWIQNIFGLPVHIFCSIISLNADQAAHWHQPQKSEKQDFEN